MLGIYHEGVSLVNYAIKEVDSQHKWWSVPSQCNNSIYTCSMHMMLWWSLLFLLFLCNMTGNIGFTTLMDYSCISKWALYLFSSEENFYHRLLLLSAGSNLYIILHFYVSIQVVIKNIIYLHDDLHITL